MRSQSGLTGGRKIRLVFIYSFINLLLNRNYLQGYFQKKFGLGRALIEKRFSVL